MTTMTQIANAEVARHETPLRYDLLSIYLNDHHGGAVGGVELAKRALEENDDNEYTAFLSKLVADLDSDRQALLDVMESFGFQVSAVKAAGGWIAEKLSRLKTNGQLTGYSPLSRVLELEALLGGSRARLSLFANLHMLMADTPGAVLFDLKRRADRAEDHLRELSELSEQACLEAFVA